MLLKEGTNVNKKVLLRDRKRRTARLCPPPDEFFFPKNFQGGPPDLELGTPHANSVTGTKYFYWVQHVSLHSSFLLHDRKRRTNRGITVLEPYSLGRRDRDGGRGWWMGWRLGDGDETRALGGLDRAEAGDNNHPPLLIADTHLYIKTLAFTSSGMLIQT